MCVQNICTCRDMRISPFYEYYGGHLGFLQNITCYTWKKKWNPIFYLPLSYSEPESVAKSILTSKKSESCFYDKWACTRKHIQGVMGFLITALLQIYQGIFQWKKWTWVKIYRIMVMSLWSLCFGPPCSGIYLRLSNRKTYAGQKMEWRELVDVGE